MRLKFFGAAGMVTGSCYWLRGERSSLVVDLGMFQGEGDEKLNADLPEIETGDLKGVVLTHAHLDHCGRLPILVRLGFKGEILMTRATRELMELVLLDAVKVGREEGDGGLYGMAEVEEILSRVRLVEFGKMVRLGGFEVSLVRAGHILGAASVVVNEMGKNKQVVFSGDLGSGESPIIQPAQIPGRAEVVVMESTYGDRLHVDSNEEEILQEEMERVSREKGVLLIPAFSIQRTQRLLYRLGIISRQGKIPKGMKVYVDSPMAIEATRIFDKCLRSYGGELMRKTLVKEPFNFAELVLTERAWEGKKIKRDKGAKVIIAGSGMMSGGRILGHAARYLPFKTTRLLIVGFQAKGTLGRKLLEGAKEVFVYGKRVPVRGSLREVTSMSAHADQKQLLEWVEGIEGVRKVILTHGEDEARKVLGGKIRQRMGVEVVRPGLKQTLRI